MLGIQILAVGQIKEKYFSEAIAHYQKRLGPYCKTKVVELEEEALYDESPKQVSIALQKEGDRLLKNMGDSYNIAMCIEGKPISSEELAELIEGVPHMCGHNRINFIIGSSHGLSFDVKEKSDKKISFGKITLPHQLARVVLYEQIYRSMRIINNAKYHK